METLHLIPTPDPCNLIHGDEELVALFADSGLAVDLVATCSDASCPACFAPAPARAA